MPDQDVLGVLVDVTRPAMLGELARGSRSASVFLPALVFLGVAGSLFLLPSQGETQEAPTAALTQSGPWTRIDGETIALNGQIRNDSFEQFEKTFDSNVTRLVVTSIGGEVEPAIRIGQRVLDDRLDVIVEGYCLSSCANYLFLAGNNKVIRDGVVGFHGNITLSIDEAGGTEARAAQVAQQQGLSDEFERSFEQLIGRTLELERGFNERIGVSQEFFVYLAAALKTEYRNQGLSYAFFLPTNETFERFGIGDIQGVQSERAKANTEELLDIQMLLH